MHFQPQLRIPATYMRGGTSKGVLFKLTDLPAAAQAPGPARDALLLRVIGSPDPYGKHTDGMGGATSSTSKTAIVSKSASPDHDVDYLFGQVAIDKPVIDWSGNCGNLTAAVGAFAVSNGFIDSATVPTNGTVKVRIWQANIQKTIIATIPIAQGEVQEMGDFELDGVTFPSAEIQVAFVDPAESGANGIFPTGQVVDMLAVPEAVVAGGKLPATMINAGIPTVFVNATDIGYRGTELQPQLNNDPTQLARLETLRACGAVKMGLIASEREAETRQHTPKIVFVAPAQSYRAASGKDVCKSEIDCVVRALSMGKLHHAMMGTAAVAIAIAAAIPGTLVNRACGGGQRDSIRFGHPSGTLTVGAETRRENGQWLAAQAIMSRSARVLMEGVVRVPAE